MMMAEKKLRINKGTRLGYSRHAQHMARGPNVAREVKFLF